MTQLTNYGSNDELLEKAKKWGWAEPPDMVLETAAMALKLSANKSGSALVTLGPITEEQLNTLLENKPKAVLTLEWIAQNDPSLRPYIDKVLALTTGYAYYDRLDYHQTHPAMSAADVVERCKELGAVLLLIEGEKPVVVFSSYPVMMDYASASREEQAQDIIRHYVDVESTDDLLVAVGRKDEIAAVLNKAQHHVDPQHVDQTATAIFDAAYATNIFQAQLIEVLDLGLTHGVTDVAITPDESGSATILLRQNDNLHSVEPHTKLSREAYTSVFSFLAHKSGVHRGEQPMCGPCGGQILYESSAGTATLTLSFLPLNNRGEMSDFAAINIRITPQTQEVPQLQSLMFNPEVTATLQQVSCSKQGLVVIVGGPRSGKTTTIAAMTAAHATMFGDRRKRVCLESPVQRVLPNTVHSRLGLRDALCSVEHVKAHDCDLVVVGELCDARMLNCAIELAATGHLVFASVEAQNSMFALDKLLELTEPEKRTTLIESLTCIAAQRLVPQVCRECGEISEPTANERAQFDAYVLQSGIDAVMPDNVIHANEAGCEQCSGGFVGAIPVHEVLQVTPDVRLAIYDMVKIPAARNEVRKCIKDKLPQAAVKLAQDFNIELLDCLV